MKSLNKHIPTIVFLIGLGLMMLSVRAFFYPSAAPAIPAVTPLKSSNPTSSSPESATAQRRSRSVSPSSPANFHRISPSRPSVRVDDFLQQNARVHLKSVGLEMRMPEGMQFNETNDGPIRILMGSNGPDRTGLYLFSAKGKYSSNRAYQYMKDYFKDEFTLQDSAPATSYPSRTGLQNMTLLKGETSQGEEFQAYFFRDAARNESHLLFLKDDQLSRAPAKVRQIVDSVRSAPTN